MRQRAFAQEFHNSIRLERVDADPEIEVAVRLRANRRIPLEKVLLNTRVNRGEKRQFFARHFALIIFGSQSSSGLPQAPSLREYRYRHRAARRFPIPCALEYGRCQPRAGSRIAPTKPRL